MIAIVTGASSGIGLETAKALAANADYDRVILACRNKNKTVEAIALWEKSIVGKCEIMYLDLSILESVENFSKKITCKIDRLVLNAGINDYTVAGQKGTVDGFDEIWQVNFLGHFYLVHLLKAFLVKDSRVIALSSFMHWFGCADRFDQLAKPNWAGPSTLHYYSDSKLAMAVFAHELNRSNVHAICASPGAVGTDIFRTWFQGGKCNQVVRRIFNAPLLTCSEGSRTSVYACTMHVEERKFVYLTPYGQIKGYGRTAACLTDMYWFWAARDPKKFIGQCDTVVKDPSVGQLLWKLATEALGSQRMKYT